MEITLDHIMLAKAVVVLAFLTIILLIDVIKIFRVTYDSAKGATLIMVGTISRRWKGLLLGVSLSSLFFALGYLLSMRLYGDFTLLETGRDWVAFTWIVSSVTLISCTAINFLVDAFNEIHNT